MTPEEETAERERFTGPAAVLLLLFVALVVSAGSQKSETFDEGLYIAGGAAQVLHADPNIRFGHPPLLRWISGIPAVVFGGARLPGEPPWIDRGAVDFEKSVPDLFLYSVRFFYGGGNDHDRVLFWGRFPFALLGAVLGWLVFSTARRRFGPWPALGALVLFLFTPEVLAHSQWAHADLASALTIFLVALALERALRDPSPRAVALLGGALGIAASTKLTGLLLVPPVFLILALLCPGGLRSRVERLAISATAFVGVVVAAYLPKPRLFGHAFFRSDLSRLHLAALDPVLRVIPLPDSFLKGVIFLLLEGRGGHPAYFHGQLSTTGWWYYFPVAIFLKYPTPLLLLAGAGLVFLCRGSMSRASKLAWVVPPLTIVAAAMVQSVDIGVRSVLPIAPFLAVWSAAAFDRFRRGTARGAAVLLLGASAASGILAFPSFLSYFNPLMGGNRAADKWLADSNLDWGQDLPALARELRRLRISPVRVDYFGLARPEHWGIHGLDPKVVAPGWYAISRSALCGLWKGGDPDAWLRRLEPVAIPGGSISIYQVTAADLAGLEKTSDVDDTMKRGMQALYDRNDPGAAEELFRNVLAANPDHYGANYQIGVALDRLGKRPEARPYWEKSLKLAQRYADAPTLRTVQDRLAKEP